MEDRGAKMQVGIVGLPNAGKSTLFNALTKAGAPAAAYAFTTIEPNVGMVDVPDERLEMIAAMEKSAKIVPAVIKFLDIAGLVKGASKGEGLGNQFLANIRETDAIAQVVRCFDDQNVAHVEGRVDPADDIEIINIELMMADLDTVEKRLKSVERKAKTGDAVSAKEALILKKAKEHLDRGLTLRSHDFDDDETVFLKSLGLLTVKPVIFVANIGEADIGKTDNPYVKEVEAKAAAEGAPVIVLPVELEEEMGKLSDADAAEFMADLGIEELPLDTFIRASYKLLSLVTFLTGGPEEARAWTITKGTKAPQAAGKIHTDIERGFIRAEIVGFDELVGAGSQVAAKEKGLLRLEGKDYVMQDGDVVFFRFNV
jgi:GTP-binding protein YchF